MEVFFFLELRKGTVATVPFLLQCGSIPSANKPIRHWCISNLLFSLRYLKFLILIRVFFHHHWISVCSINLIRRCARMKRCMQLLTLLWGDRSWGHINHYWDSWRSISLICLGKPFTKSCDGQDSKRGSATGKVIAVCQCVHSNGNKVLVTTLPHPKKKLSGCL